MVIFLFELGLQSAEARDSQTNQRDLIGARATEIAVVREHAPEGGRILLVEQKLERFLAPDQIGRSQLRRQRRAFALQRPLIDLTLRFQGVAPLLGHAPLGAQLVELLVCASYLELGRAQTCRGRVTLGRGIRDPALDFGDLGAQFFEACRRLALTLRARGRFRQECL